MQKFIENCAFFFEGDEDEIDDTEYKSDDDDEIDSTEDDGNDDDITGTGGKMIYIYIYIYKIYIYIYIYINTATTNGYVLKTSRLYDHNASNFLFWYIEAGEGNNSTTKEG